MSKRILALALILAVLTGVASPALAAGYGTYEDWLASGTYFFDHYLEDLENEPVVEEPTEPEIPWEPVEPPVVGEDISLNTDDHVAYISGSAGKFNPTGTVSRAEAAQMLYSLLDGTCPILVSYTDVTGSEWYANAAWAMGSLGVMRANDAAFAPSEKITRGEFIAAVAAFFPLRDDRPQFYDVKEGHPYYDALRSARSWGWVTGFADGGCRPDQTITRAEAVVILNRALGRTGDQAYLDNAYPILTFLDVPAGHWAYYDIMEAAITHEYSEGWGQESWTSHVHKDSGLAQGFYSMNGWLYYYSSSVGAFVRNTTVGSFTFDGQGHYTTGNSELDAKIHNVVLAKTNDTMTREQKLRALYVYTRDSFKYLRRAPYAFGATGWWEQDALNMLNTGYGNCYSYASVFYYCARWLGYDAKIYSGRVGHNPSPHGWVEINFDGVNYIFDTELEMAKHRQGLTYINFYKFRDYNNTWNYVR